MLKKLVLIFAVLSIAAAVAGTLPTGHTNYKITLFRPAVLNGAEFKAGDCVLTLNVVDSKATLTQGKQSVVVPAKIESVDQKYDITAVRLTLLGEKQNISEIEIGGTKTKVTLNP
ncbi:MAG: hypothetical protein ACLQVN_02960 [Bryobacteraceae bacterium]